MCVVTFVLIAFVAVAKSEKDDNGDIVSDIKSIKTNVELMRKDIDVNRVNLNNLVEDFKNITADMHAMRGMLAKPGTERNPGRSCKQLKEDHPDLKSGMYWVKLEKATRLYCDMDTDKGGWTLVGKATVETEAEATEIYFKKLLSNDTSRLSDVSGNRFLLDTLGLRTLQSYISFSSIRWFCHKPWHGRTLSMYTANNKLGHDVVDYMLDRISSYDNSPASCGSFTRLDNDNSVIGQSCERWWLQKWYGRDDWHDEHNGRVYVPMGIRNHNWFNLGRGDTIYTQVDCDDRGTEPNFSTIGEWMVYVK